MKTAIFYEGVDTPTDDNDDKLIIDYNNNTQTVFLSDSDVSGESTKVQAIHTACFS
jgi:hypothetical protein